MLFFLWIGNKPKTSHTTHYKTDTIYIDRVIEVIKVSEPIKPKTIIIYRADTTARKAAEKANIITGIEVKNNKVEISTITPRGIASVSSYPVPDFSELRIDQSGKVEVKERKKRKVLKRIAVITVAVAYICVVHSF